ncbi:MAG: ATPase, partial [Planctomycetales bacterium]|nr:ATPase [Planctomycetales bacterium]
MSGYFLGVDVGATKSQALVADAGGWALGLDQAGPGNPMNIGYERFAGLLRDVSQAARAAAGIELAQIRGAGFGIAGYDWPSQRQPCLDAIQTLGLHARLDLVNDALVALLAGATQGWGVAVVAGTSCNCWGWDAKRRVGRMTGFSWLGEAAGAHELVRRALGAVAHAWTQRGPATQLTEAFCRRAGVPDAAALLEGLTLGHIRIGPATAPLVFQAAAAGDRVAYELITWAGGELGDLAVGVIRQLALEALSFEVVLAGNFFNGSPRLAEIMAEVIHAVAPGARLVRLG